MTLPDCGVRVRAVPVSVLRDWNEDELPALHFPDFTLRDAQFGWIDEIVSRVNEQDRRLDLVEVSRRVIVARSVDRVKEIVRIQAGGRALHEIVEVIVRRIARRHVILRTKWSAAGD